MFSTKLLSLLGLLAPALSLPAESPPAVHLLNGSYFGIADASQNLDQFLGIPYAQPPLGDLRFRQPQPLASSWTGLRNATELQSPCYQYGSGPLGAGAEDCLTINIIRPAGISPDASLPVAFWIHGGGLVGGSNSDPSHDLTHFVEESVRIGKPVIAAGINYRLHAWGFLWGSAVEAEGGGNLGFRDQRLALHWIQENVKAFGGDPDKVTIWGQSGGARGVASQITAFGGRDDGLFRAAIMQSATGFHTDFGEVEGSGPTWDEAYDSVLERVGCAGAEDSLACLRGVESRELATAFGETTFPSWLDIVDGTFVQRARAEALHQGQFVRVPVINGITTDDGDYFAKRSINTDAQWEDWLRSTGASNETIAALSVLYPDDPDVGLPATFSGRPTGDLLESYGSQWKRAVAFGGDRAMQAPRRAWVHTWAKAGLQAWSYRFDVVTGDRPAIQGAGHSVEVPFTMHNMGAFNRSSVPVTDEFRRLADVMTGQWVRFINDLDPNGGCGVVWPAYDVQDGQNMVYTLAEQGLMRREDDTFRSEQFAYLDDKLWRAGLKPE